MRPIGRRPTVSSPREPASTDLSRVQPPLDVELVRMIFTAAALVSVVAALAIWIVHAPASEVSRHALATGALVLAAGLWWARHRAHGQHMRLALVVMAWTASIFALAVATFIGQGLRSVSLGVVPLMVCLLAVVGSTQLALGLAACALLGLLGLARLHALHPAEMAARIVGAPIHDALTAHAIVLFTALILGIAVARVAERHRRRAAEREARFVALLGIAADAYWETDAGLNLQTVWRRSDSGDFELLDIGHGRKAWELPTLQFDPDVLQPLREAMVARERIRDIALRHRAEDGRLTHLVANGEPRLDADGKFIGYWGLVTDISEQVRIKRDMMASESRYRHLFDGSPTPLVLHRDGRALMANAALARLLRYPDAEAMTGVDIFSHLTDEAQRDLARQRCALAADLEPGACLPFEAFRAVACDGTRLWVKTTVSRVQTDEGPALLTMFIDETGQRGAQDAARHTQDLLERVVSTSPDVITLTDLRTGRYRMVNAMFCRMTGYSTAEVIGRTALELGVWRSTEERERLVGELERTDTVRDMPLVFVTRDGTPLPMLVSASRFELAGQPYLVINARDTSEADRSRLERAAILDNASIGIAFTRDRKFVVVNKRMEQMLGWPPGDLVGQPASVVWPSEEAYASVGREHGPALGRGEQVEIEQPVRRRDGSTFLARMLAKAIDPTRPTSSGTVWIVDDVTEMRQVEAALAKARDDAEAASRAKSAFLANTSHEIRTPLNGLVGLARLARAPDLDDAHRRRYLEQIGNSAEGLSAIISDILDLSKIEAGKLELESVPFDLHAMLGDLHLAYAALADSKGLRFSLDRHPDLHRLVRGDPVRVRQILANYLSNGLKFTERGSLVLRAGPAGDGRVRFEVQDTGPGIDAGTQARLFSPFTQADDSTTRRYGGTGLGLSICRELAEHMGGAVGLASTPGLGSTFWAELPLPPADAAGKDSDFGGLQTDPLVGAHVLLVEDNPVNMMIGVALVEHLGAQVTQAADGAQAVEMALRSARAGKPFDLVLMDIQMPGMSGHEATRTLRRYFSRAELSIVALTAAALVSEREQALEAGMDDFVTKPIDERRLRGTLARVLANRRKA